MDYPMEHNPAAYDPAVLYWDWERTKILNYPPGLGNTREPINNQPVLEPPEQPPWDKPYFQRPGKSRAGTLRRENSFIEDKRPLPAVSYHQQTSYSETVPDSNNPTPLDTKPNFPETLYSSQKRKTVEDICSRFIKSVQELDKGNPGELVDFNSILESHWSELADFYWEQVSTVRKSGQAVESTALSAKEDLSKTASQQLPNMNLGLAESKLHPEFRVKNEVEMSFPTLLKSETSYPLLKHPRSPKKLVRAKFPVSPYKSHKTNSAEKNYYGNKNKYKNSYLNKTDRASPSRPAINVSPENKVTKTIQSIATKAWGSAKITPDGIQIKDIYKNLETIPRTLKEAAVFIPSSHIEFDVKRLAEATNTGNLVNNFGTSEPRAIEMNNIQNKDVGVISGPYSDRDLQYFDTDNTGDSGLCETTDTMDNKTIAKSPAGAEFKASIGSTQLQSMEDDNTNETHINIAQNVSHAKIKVVKSSKLNVDSNDIIEGGRDKILLPKDPELDIQNITETNSERSSFFIEDEINSNGEDSYRPNLDTISNKISSLMIDEDLELLNRSDISYEADQSADIVYDISAYKETGLEVAGITAYPINQATLPIQDPTKGQILDEEILPLSLIVGGFLPRDSNDSFSVSSDSSLSFSSTKDKLEKLQMEVTSHLERTERMGGTFFSRWIDEFGVKKEISEECANQSIKYSTTTRGKLDENDKKDTKSEDYEVEFEDGNEDEVHMDDDTDEEMKETLERINEFSTGEPTNTDMTKTHICDPNDETMDSKDAGSGGFENYKKGNKEGDENQEKVEYKGEEDGLKVTKRLVFERELSIVTEEEEDEEEGRRENNSDMNVDQKERKEGSSDMNYEGDDDDDDDRKEDISSNKDECGESNDKWNSEPEEATTSTRNTDEVNGSNQKDVDVEELFTEPEGESAEEVEVEGANMETEVKAGN